jgi:anti-sigma regulatory factor (Ser/Thr protein kinase)
VRTDSVTTELSVRFSGGPYAAAAARRALGGLRDVVGPERLEDVFLLVSELVTNGVRHAGAGEADELELDVRRDADRLRVEVADPGPGFRGAHARPRGDDTGGWGLYLVEQIADRWGVQRDEAGANVVWFELRGAGSVAAAA